VNLIGFVLGFLAVIAVFVHEGLRKREEMDEVKL